MQVHTRMSREMIRSEQPHLILQLHAQDGDARRRVVEAVERVVALDEPAPRMRVVLSGDQLPAATIAGLVAGLRMLRERSGAIEIEPATPAIREALALTGLDRVFAFPLDPEARALRGQPSRKAGVAIVKAAAAALVAVLALLRFPASAAAPIPTDPSAIVARVVERNPDLSSYEGRMHVDLKLTSFPFISRHFDASTYFKRPANYEVVFDRVPTYASGFAKLFTDVGDPTNWERRFRISFAGEQDVRGHRDVVLRLVQRVRGMIDHETVLIDPNAWAIDSIRYDYYNGGHVTMTQTFRQVGSYSLLAEQDAEIAIPHVRAVAHGTYTDYKTNVALDDAVFSKKN